MQEIVVAASLDQIPVISEFIEALMTSSGFDLHKTLQVMLAVEEACTNIALYAYSGKENIDGSMRIIADEWSDRMELTIQDGGVPFDPMKHGMPISDACAEVRPIGGLGIHLIKSYVDEIRYKYVDGKNILTLIKKR